MVTEQGPYAPSFEGSDDEQQAAAQIYALLRARGRFVSVNAPIRVDLKSVVEFLGANAGIAADQVEAAIAANPTVFQVETVNEQKVLVTSRTGGVPRVVEPSREHSFHERFMTPQPKPEKPIEPVRERARVDPSWARLPVLPDDLSDLIEEEEFEHEPLEIEHEPIEVAPMEEAAPVVEAEPPEVVEEPARTITVPAAAPTDVSGIDDTQLADAIRDRLQADIRVANFGDDWMAEDRVPRFSRGDLRRLKDYIQEQEQPLADDVLVQDVLGIRPATPDFDLMRFALNFRLSREHRDFEFVGTNNQRFWSTSSLPQIGTTRRKPNEIGTDYRFLLDEAAVAPAPRSLAAIDHVVTFYEYYLGLLPYDEELQALLPAPLQPGQRSAVLTFECPQTYTTYLVELRYPSPNRGGFIVGLDDFYSESLVPGAIISISATENDGHFRVEFLEGESQQERLLELDERRSRYVFRPTTFTCGVMDNALLTEDKYARLGAERPLDDRTRRRPEAVVAATFERIGEQVDGGFRASFDDLLAVTNVERPFSATLLRSILDQDDTGAFARDTDGADAYTYVPGSTSAA